MEPFDRRTLPKPTSWLAYAGAWTVLGIVYAALFAAGGLAAPMALRGAAATVIPNALFGRISLGLARRVPWPADGRLRSAVLLVLCVLGLAVLSTAGWLGLILLDGLLVTGVPKLPPAPIVAWQIVISDLTHATLAGLGYAFHAARAVRDAQERAARADVLRARAELQLLRSQLHPHFVLNTLHALLGLVRRDPAQAEQALERLGDLLRFGQWVHQSGTDFVPLAREWDFVRSYLDLERLRLGPRLAVSLEAEESALGVPVPPFALQPLVENAVLHGVATRASGGRIALAARRSDGRLHVTVQDDGAGTSEEAIAASPRIGLRLLQERLAALYGGRARLTYESPEAGGFRVRLDVPDDPASEAS